MSRGQRFFYYGGLIALLDAIDVVRAALKVHSAHVSGWQYLICRWSVECKKRQHCFAQKMFAKELQAHAESGLSVGTKEEGVEVLDGVSVRCAK